MSFALWDELLLICIELAEYDKEKDKIAREPLPPRDPKEFAIAMPIPTGLTRIA